MLDLTRIQGTFNPIEMTLDPTVRPLESGLAYVVATDDNGQEVIKPSTGVAGEHFVGVAYMDKIASATGVRVGFALMVPSSGVQAVVLPDQLGIANLKIVDMGTAVNPTEVVIDSADYTLAGYIVTFGNSNYAGHNIAVTYNYTLSEMQKAQLGISPIGSASEFIHQLSTLQGTVRCHVTNFDADAAWAVDADVRLAAGGFFTVGGPGVVVGKCNSVPTALDPFLGLSYHAF